MCASTFFYLLRYSASTEDQVLQPAKDVKFRAVSLKSCRQEKKSIMHQDSLKPHDLIVITKKFKEIEAAVFEILNIKDFNELISHADYVDIP